MEKVRQDKPIGLIIPPSVFLLDERVFPSGGLLKIAAVLERAKLNVVVIDLSGIENYAEVLVEALREYDFFFLGITATSPQMVPVNTIANLIRSNSPQTPICIGGPHVSAVFTSERLDKQGKGSGRGIREMAELNKISDILVAGDGEISIFKVIEAVSSGARFPIFINADDVDSKMFLSENDLNNLPFPARHLIDLKSYHYSIEGRPATSLISELGCLAAGTKITLANGKCVPIGDIQADDEVVCWDEMNEKLATGSVTKVWSREASDLWSLQLSDGTILKVTSEHPIWTEDGWKKVEELKLYERIAIVPEVRQEIYGQGIQDQKSKILQQGMREIANSSRLSDLRKMFYSIFRFFKKGKLLFAAMQSRMAEAVPIGEVTSGNPQGTEGHESEVGRYDSRRETKKLKHRNTIGFCQDGSGKEDFLRNETGRPESYETSRSSSKGFKYNKSKRSKDGGDFESAKEEMERGEDALSLGKERCSISKFSRGALGRFIKNLRTGFFLGRGRFFLDWPMSVWQAAQSRFYKQATEKNNIASWGVLAPGEVGSRRKYGLYAEGVERARNMEQGTQSQETSSTHRENYPLQFIDIVSRKFIGKSPVYNITVCPGHSYIADGIVVHNCSYGCFFCGMRNSPSFRRIRARSPAVVREELVHLYETYGYTGYMFSDDELNIPSSFSSLMGEIIKAQEEVKQDFRLRGFIKSNLFTEDQAKLMYEAGFRNLLVGFESGSDRILTNINKRATRAQNTRCMEIARKYNLKIKALMSLSHSGESEKTIRETEEWLLEVQPDDIDVTLITVYFGTPLADFAKPHRSISDCWTFTAPKTGDRLHFYETNFAVDNSYYKGQPGAYRCLTFSDYLSCEELVKLRDDLEANVRNKLNIPFYPASPASRVETSMGQGLPGYILRSTN